MRLLKIHLIQLIKIQLIICANFWVIVSVFLTHFPGVARQGNDKESKCWECKSPPNSNLTHCGQVGDLDGFMDENYFHSSIVLMVAGRGRFFANFVQSDICAAFCMISWKEEMKSCLMKNNYHEDRKFLTLPAKF